MTKKEIEDNLKTGECGLASNNEKFQWTNTANAMKKMLEENKKLKDNWNKLKEYLINDINNRNGNKVIEYEDSRKASETISPIYILMEDRSKTIKEVLDKMQELEQGSDK